MRRRLSCAAPALLLLLGPAQAGEIGAQDVPSAGFFVRRVLLGAAVGVGLLLVLIGGATLETLEGYGAWGERLQLIPAGSGHGGLLFSFLTVCQLALLLLCGVNLLLGGEEALCQAFPALRRHRAAMALLLALCTPALAAMAVLGFDLALAAGVIAGVPAAAVLAMGGKRA
ncbi:MAG: hypothetical protein IKU34_00265 [Clostridia bacterium]|nr:hypothetical protein [Clostridia bacterium]